MAPLTPAKGYWWLSFADAKKFYGVCIVRSEETLVDAVRESVEKGCNPGWGNVKGTYLGQITVDPQFENRLLSHDEAKFVSEALWA